MKSNFTKEQIEYIKEKYPSEQTWIIADYLNSTVKEVSDYATKVLHLKKNDNYFVVRKESKLNKTQIDYIYENYSSKTNKEIAEFLGVSLKDVKGLAGRKKLKKAYNFKQKYTSDEIEKIKEDYPYYSNETLAKKYNLSIGQISYLANEYDFPNKDPKSKQLNRTCKLTREQKIFIGFHKIIIFS